MLSYGICVKEENVDMDMEWYCEKDDYRVMSAQSNMVDFGIGFLPSFSKYPPTEAFSLGRSWIYLRCNIEVKSCHDGRLLVDTLGWFQS